MSSFTEEESFFTPRKLLIGLSGFVLVIVLAIATPFALENAGKGFENSPFSRKATPEMLEAELGTNPQFRGTVTAFRTHYPQEYQAFLRRVADTANRQGRAAAERESFYFMRGFMTSKADAMASAPEADLRQLGDALLELMKSLQRSDVALCGRVIVSGFSPGQIPPPEVLTHINRINMLQIRAARHGEDRGRVTRGELGDADARAWVAQMQKIDPASAELIQSGTIERGSPDAQCRAGVVIYQAANALPPAPSANVTAHLVRESFQGS